MGIFITSFMSFSSMVWFMRTILKILAKNLESYDKTQDEGKDQSNNEFSEHFLF